MPDRALLWIALSSPVSVQHRSQVSGDSTPSDQSDCPVAVTIGTFDGVHAGHRSIVERARVLVDRARHPLPGRVVALVFDPNPADILRPKPPGTPSSRLTTFEVRRRYLLDAGCDHVERLEPTSELLALEPEAFLRQLVARHRPAFIVEGADFRFGHRRIGGIDTLRTLGPAMNFQTEIVPELSVPLMDHTLAPARSTTIRALLAAGRVRDAAAVLTRPYAISGTVVRGDRRGRTIGFPTANIDSPCVAPGDGVYAGLATLPDGSLCPAAISVGSKPHFATGNARAIEAFLMPLGVSSIPDPMAPSRWHALPGCDEYGWSISLAFVGWVRDQMRFPSLNDLLAQMARDCARACDIVLRPAAHHSEQFTEAVTQPLPHAKPTAAEAFA